MRPAFASHKKTNPSEKRLGLFFASHGGKTETARCLGCGAVVVDNHRCIGCGLCTTRCKFEAITLHRDHPEASEMAVAEDKFGKILPNRVKRAARTACGPGRFCATIGIYIFVAICLATYTPLAEA